MTQRHSCLLNFAYSNRDSRIAIQIAAAALPRARKAAAQTITTG